MAKCYSCGKTSKGNMPTAKIKGEERSYCADCYWKIDKEYKSKKNCEDCSYFSKEKCKKKNKKLEATTVGYNTYFVQAETCGDFSTDKEVAIAEVKKLESQGQFEDAVLGYEKLGMNDEADEVRKKLGPTDTVDHQTAEKELVRELSKKGRALTYYCPHCGAPLRLGALSPKIQETCPKCKGDLKVINLGKLIKQHLD